MVFLYNIAVYLGFLALAPRFLYDAATGGKWSAGFRQRLGDVPAVNSDGRRVVLLHCVSVGEVNAAFPLAKELRERSPEIVLVVSTTTRTGQAVAKAAYAGVADQVVYFPFDLGWSVKRFLRRIKPDLVLLTETELWFNFIRLARRSTAKIVIVNGRLSERSYRRYSRIKGLMRSLLGSVDLALMQGDADAHRVTGLGAANEKVHVTGNIKFDIETPNDDGELTRAFAERFGITADRPLILAASTHSPEERWLLEAFKQVRQNANPAAAPRLMLVPRHPERFAEVASLIEESGLALARRSVEPSGADKTADVILLDSVGELRSAYPLAEIVFVGGSLIPHGGQSIFEPAVAGKAIITGPFTANFDAAVKEFRSKNALVQLSDVEVISVISAFEKLLAVPDQRHALGNNALAVIQANRGATERTIQLLTPLLTSTG